MQNSIYYNLKLVEGSDIVNPLTVDVPNYEIIDEQMHNNSVASVGLATELANGSTHAITRENSECSVFRFIATAEWKLGDSVSVDGVPVSALLPSGETLPAGAYVINANVLCILTGTNLTIYTERKKVEYANEIKYNDTTVESELNKLNSNLGKFGTPIDIADTIGQYYGFIPADDGIVEVVINPADANPAYYVVLSNDGLGSKGGTWARVNSFNGFEASISFPVRAGVTYKKSAAVNCTERVIYIPNK